MTQMEQLQYRIIRSSRRTAAIQITPWGEVVVRCPKRMPADAVDAFVRSKAGWIEKHISKLAQDKLLPVFTPQELDTLRREAKVFFAKRTAYFAPVVGVEYEKVTVRFQRSRWGSCSGKGNLNFNCLLMLAPPAVADYVVVHELCHRKEMNHSPKFWQEVERVLPEYKDSRKWLKDQGKSLIGRLPENLGRKTSQK